MCCLMNLVSRRVDVDAARRSNSADRGSVIVAERSQSPQSALEPFVDRLFTDPFLHRDLPEAATRCPGD
jgi:hypothetical protein